MDERPPPIQPGPSRPHVGEADLQGRLDAVAEAAGAFAHDLKNPLSALLLGVQRLARLADPARQGQTRELAARLERSIQAMSKLVDGHADLARLHAGQLQLEPSRLPCAAVLIRGIEPLQAGAAERKQELRVNLAPDLPEVEWDAERVAEALEQLLATALRLAPEGDTISCAAEAAGSEVVITVTVGPAASAPDVVPSTTPGRRIRGSGLLVARSLVEAHGGRLTLEDGTEQTTVRVILPARP